MGVQIAEINLKPSDNAERFDERQYGPAAQVVPAPAEETVAAGSL
jgi:hypothetical protein